MTPKEKASQIFNRFFLLTKNGGIAIKCSRYFVEQIMDELKEDSVAIAWWGQVKSELFYNY